MKVLDIVTPSNLGFFYLPPRLCIGVGVYKIYAYCTCVEDGFILVDNKFIFVFNGVSFLIKYYLNQCSEVASADAKALADRQR